MVHWLDDEELLRALADEALDTLISQPDAVAATDSAAAPAQPQAALNSLAANTFGQAPDDSVLEALVDDVLDELIAGTRPHAAVAVLRPAHPHSHSHSHPHAAKVAAPSSLPVRGYPRVAANA